MERRELISRLPSVTGKLRVAIRSASTGGCRLRELFVARRYQYNITLAVINHRPTQMIVYLFAHCKSICIPR